MIFAHQFLNFKMNKYTKHLSLVILALLMMACSKDSDKNFTLKGTVKGLKKGVVYLQKDGDSSVINLDSMKISGESEFTLHANLEEPRLLYLKLFKNDGEEHYIPFFADKGLTEINTSLKNFNFDAEISGSKQQEVLEEYLDIIDGFKNQNLDLIEASFLAQRDNDSLIIDSLNRKADQLVKRKYSFTIQYALNNRDSEVAPYLAVYEIPAANPKFIDSIYNSLTEPVKNSLYGKQLGDMISKRNSVE